MLNLKSFVRILAMALLLLSMLLVTFSNAAKAQAKFSPQQVTTYPTVLNSQPTDPNPTWASQIHFIVTFSEPVTGVDKSDFRMVTSEFINAGVVSVTGGPTAYTLTANVNSGNGSVRVGVLDDNSIVNINNAPLNGPSIGSINSNFGLSYIVRPTTETFRSQALQDGCCLNRAKTAMSLAQ